MHNLGRPCWQHPSKHQATDHLCQREREKPGLVRPHLLRLAAAHLGLHQLQGQVRHG
jgi:hypothetical protein